MRIFQEEIFGPVVAVTTFSDERDALTIANQTPYGLGAGVWTRDNGTAYRMGRDLQAGSGMDELLPPLPRPGSLGRPQAIRYRQREPPAHPRPLSADQEHPDQLRPQADGPVLTRRIGGRPVRDASRTGRLPVPARDPVLQVSCPSVTHCALLEQCAAAIRPLTYQLAGDRVARRLFRARTCAWATISSARVRAMARRGIGSVDDPGLRIADEPYVAAEVCTHARPGEMSECASALGDARRGVQGDRLPDQVDLAPGKSLRSKELRREIGSVDLEPLARRCPGRTARCRAAHRRGRAGRGRRRRSTLDARRARRRTDSCGRCGWPSPLTRWTERGRAWPAPTARWAGVG